MDLKSTDRSRVFVEVRSKGLLGALEHHLIFAATPETFVVSGVGDDGAIDVAIEATVVVANLVPPLVTSPSDRERMLDNLRGRDVLDAQKFPTLTLRGHYTGTLDSGTLKGDLVLRGSSRAIAFAVRANGKNGDARRFDAVWEGTQTELGIKPFRAMLGALQLRDWMKIRLEIELL